MNNPIEGCLVAILFGVLFWALIILLGIGLDRVLIILWNFAGKVLAAL